MFTHSLGTWTLVFDRAYRIIRDDAAAVHSAVNCVSGKSGDSLGALDPGVFMRRDPENDP